MHIIIDVGLLNASLDFEDVKHPSKLFVTSVADLPRLCTMKLCVKFLVFLGTLPWVAFSFVPMQTRLAPGHHSGFCKRIVRSELYASSMPLSNRSPMQKMASSGRSFASSVKSKIQNSEVSFWRAAALTFFSTLITYRSAIDIQLVHLWTFLTTSPHLVARIFRTDSYEWVLAITCFSVYIHFFGYGDRAVRRADREGRIHPWKKYRLQDRYEADKHRRMMEKRALNGVDVSTEGVRPNLETQQSKWNYGAWMCEFWVYALPLLTWDILSPRRFRRIGAFAAPTTMQILGGVAGGLFLYDLMFFVGHFLMHKIPFLYRTIHTKHHKTQEVRAAEIVRLSIAEEVLEVGFSIVALNLLSVHPFARSIYNIIITFLLTELHSGFDFPWTPQNVVPFGLATGSRRHHYHHRVGKHYYQKFFYHVDRFFGTYQKDDGSLNGDSVQKNPYVPPAWQTK